jgi:diguanylate cyclase
MRCDEAQTELIHDPTLDLSKQGSDISDEPRHQRQTIVNFEARAMLFRASDHREEHVTELSDCFRYFRGTPRVAESAVPKNAKEESADVPTQEASRPSIRSMTLRSISHSIVTRLLLFGAALVLLDAGVRYFLLTDFLREDLIKVVSAQQESLAGYVARDVDSKIVERQLLLKQLASALPLELLGQPDALQQWLGERYELQPLFSQALFVTDLTGTTIADYPARPERVGMSYADRDYVRDALSGTPAIGRPVIGRVAKEGVLPIAVPIRDAQGQIRGVLAGITTLAAPGFLYLPQQSRIGVGGGFLLISPRDKLFVAATRPEMVLQPTPDAGVNLLHDRAMAGFRGSGVTVNAQGVEEISAMASVPSTGWFVVARIPTSEALATVSRTQRYIQSSSAVVMVAFLVLAALGLFLVFRPLFRAANYADRMTRGELPMALLPVALGDEVGHLTGAFNRLLAKLQSSQTALTRIAHQDPLTGLPNRAVLADRLHQSLARARRNEKLVAVLYLDLDGFKPINDSLGHEAGDAALVEVSGRIGQIVRAVDTFARIGGDEFVIVIEELDLPTERAVAAASAVAAKCLEAIAPSMVLKGEHRQLGLSIGIALGDGRSSFDALRIAADGAMYKAKRAGGGRFVVAGEANDMPQLVQATQATQATQAAL